jgi:hypothetical protein
VKPPVRVGLSSVVFALLVAGSGRGFAAAEGPVVLPSEDPPAVAAALGPLEGLLALALSRDGTAAAAAFASEEPGRCLLRLVGPQRKGTETLELPGIARALVFSPDGSRLYALVEKARRAGPEEVFLYEIVPETLRSTKGILLPPGARGLAVSPDQSVLLVASRDEVRSFRLPTLASGPLYRVPGDNLAIADLGGGDVLLGRPDGLFLVRLLDPQGREGLPVREKASTPQPVVALAASPSGEAALARLAGGAIYDVRFDPLRAEEAGRNGAAVAWLGTPTPEEAPNHFRRRSQKAPPESAGELAVAARPIAEPRAALGPEKNTEETEAPKRPVTGLEPEREEAEPPALRPLEAEPAPAEPLTPSSASPGSLGVVPGSGTLYGRLSGPARDGVVAVVIAGPGNLLRVAARIVPSRDGRWSSGPLEPGLYRVVLAGEGGRAVVSEPSFQTVRLEAGDRIELREFRAIRIE